MNLAPCMQTHPASTSAVRHRVSSLSSPTATGTAFYCGSWPFGYYNIYLDGEVVATGGQYGQQDLVYIACETGDCSSYMTLSSSPSGCDASGSDG